MNGLLEPGGTRAGDLFTDAAVLSALLRVETAWLAGLVHAEIAPGCAAVDLAGLITEVDLPSVAAAAEGGGTPVLPFLALLRTRLSDENADAANWVHRGLTSQDVLDTALMLCARDVLSRLLAEVAAQIRSLVGLIERHGDTVMAGRTVTQLAVPITFGVKAAGWLDGILNAAALLESADAALPAQFGGAAGTLSAATELAALAGHADPAQCARDLAADAARRLNLLSCRPWHTTRTPVTRLGDALTTCCDAFGRIANDVLTLSRPEIAELAEPTGPGRGGSSTMPHKVNPVLAVLIRKAALAAPTLGAQLHLAAADARDERPDGAWQLEWPALRSLARGTVGAASQTSELLAGLHVDENRMGDTVALHLDDLMAEKRSLAALFGGRGDDGTDAYLGASRLIVDETLARAATHLKGTR